jgi:hypothetical protein
VATGFDDTYYAKRSAGESTKSVITTPTISADPQVTTKQDEKTLSEIDMNLDDDKESSTDFSKEHVMPNIWTIDDDNDDADKSDSSDKHKSDHDNTSSDDEHNDLDDDLEKPSFLRRLSLRRKDESDNKSDPKSDS